jgi:hypothetical protein
VIVPDLDGRVGLLALDHRLVPIGCGAVAVVRGGGAILAEWRRSAAPARRSRAAARRLVRVWWDWASSSSSKVRMAACLVPLVRGQITAVADSSRASARSFLPSSRVPW